MPIQKNRRLFIKIYSIITIVLNNVIYIILKYEQDKFINQIQIHKKEISKGI